MQHRRCSLIVASSLALFLLLGTLLLVSVATAAPSSSDSRGTSFNVPGYMAWLNNNKAELRNLKFADFVGFGPGLEAEKNIKEGDMLLSVPVELFLNSRVARFGILAELVQAFPEVNDQLLLALEVLAHKFSDDSRFKGWLESLPTSFSTPLYFSEEETKELKGSSLVSLTKTRLEQMHKTYESLVDFFGKSANLTKVYESSKFSFEEFKWAIAIITAKSFTLNLSDGTVTCMIPGLDAFNHASVSTDFKFNNETKAFEVYALTPVDKGDQVFINTGKKTNLDLLLSNGYVLDDPKFDVVLISTRLNDDAEDRKLKKAVLELKNLNEDGFYYVNLDDTPHDLLAALRVQLARGDELVKLAATNDTAVPVSLENELAVFRTLLSAAEAMFKEYETSVEEDDKRLKQSISHNVRSAIRLRRGEKQVLQALVNKLVLQWRDFLIYDFPPQRPEDAAKKAKRAAAEEEEEPEAEAKPKQPTLKKASDA